MASEAAADVDDVDAPACAEIEDLQMKRSGRKNGKRTFGRHTPRPGVFAPHTFVHLGHSGPPELDTDTVFHCAQVSVFTYPWWT